MSFQPRTNQTKISNRPSVHDFLDFIPKDHTENDKNNDNGDRRNEQSLFDYLVETPRSQDECDEQNKISIICTAEEKAATNASDEKKCLYTSSDISSLDESCNKNFQCNNKITTKGSTVDEIHQKDNFQKNVMQDQNLRKVKSNSIKTMKTNFNCNSNRNEEFTVKDKVTSARVIQLWWRRIRNRRTAGKAAMQRMMENKRNELQNKLNQQRKQVFNFHFLLKFYFSPI